MKTLTKENKITFGRKLWGHIILARPKQLIWLDVFATMSFYAIVTRHAPGFHFILFILCAVIADAGACTINDVGDVDSDCKSKESSRKKRPLCTGTITKKAAKIQAAILYSIGLALALYLDFFVFLCTLGLVIISWQYSMKPLKMDGRPVISQMFWVTFGFLYFFALVAYLARYENIPIANVYHGLYFLMAMILFLAIAETMAKDLRDLENDRLGGKNTTPSYFGPRPAVVVSFCFSVIGMIFWAIPYFTVYETHFTLQIVIILLMIVWNIICFSLCRAIYRNYTKGKARKLHKGYILTFTSIMTISFIGGIF